MLVKSSPLLLILLASNAPARDEPVTLSAYPASDRFLSIEEELDLGVIPDFRALLEEHGSRGVQRLLQERDPRVFSVAEGESYMHTLYRQSFLSNYLRRILRRWDKWEVLLRNVEILGLESEEAQREYLWTNGRSVEPMFLNSFGVYVDFTAEVAEHAAGMPRLRSKMAEAIAAEAARARVFGPELDALAVELESIDAVLQSIDHAAAAPADYARVQQRLLDVWRAIARGDYRSLGKGGAGTGVGLRAVTELRPVSVFEPQGDVFVGDDGAVLLSTRGGWALISGGARAEIDGCEEAIGFDAEGRAVLWDREGGENELLFFRDGRRVARTRLPTAFGPPDDRRSPGLGVRAVRRVELSADGVVEAFTGGAAFRGDRRGSLHEVFSLDRFLASASGVAALAGERPEHCALEAVATCGDTTVVAVRTPAGCCVVLATPGGGRVLARTGQQFDGGIELRKVWMLGLDEDGVLLVGWGGEQATPVRVPFAEAAAAVVVPPADLELRTAPELFHLGKERRAQHAERLRSRNLELLHVSPGRVALVSDGRLFSGPTDRPSLALKPGDRIEGLGVLEQIRSVTLSRNGRYAAVIGKVKGADGESALRGFCVPLGGT